MKISRTNLIAGTFASLWVLTSMAAPSLAAQPASSRSALKMDKVDSAGIEANRRRIMSQEKAKEAKSLADFKTKRSAFLQNQKAQLEARNAQAKAEMSRLKAKAEQIEKIRAEALQLNAKFVSASPAEQARMEKRADELTAELNRLGY